MIRHYRESLKTVDASICVLFTKCPYCVEALIYNTKTQAQLITGGELGLFMNFVRVEKCTAIKQQSIFTTLLSLHC